MSAPLVNAASKTLLHRSSLLQRSLPVAGRAAVVADPRGSSVPLPLPPPPQQRRQFSQDDDGPKKRTKFQNKNKKKKGDNKKGGISLSDKDKDSIVECMDPPITYPPPASDEEMKRRYEIGVNHVKGKFQQHNERNHDLSCKIKMKQHALNMLPKRTYLRDAALKIDLYEHVESEYIEDDEDEKEEKDRVVPPTWRVIPSYTPPIKDFNPDDFTIEKEY